MVLILVNEKMLSFKIFISVGLPVLLQMLLMMMMMIIIIIIIIISFGS